MIYPAIMLLNFEVHPLTPVYQACSVPGSLAVRDVDTSNNDRHFQHHCKCPLVQSMKTGSKKRTLTNLARLLYCEQMPRIQRRTKFNSDSALHPGHPAVEDAKRYHLESCV
ncbi:hypothetical protein HGRIS_002864 [Hohenbuehelia grisea]|uniref:Uncharacterized protein n=1 Tax=Hohenbuehelia grisea TaxID=104357 RepID=A0ABR3JMQ4_9AGAR